MANNYSGCRSKLLEIAYNAANESIAQQRQDLRAVRGHASIIAALSGLIATLFAPIVLETAKQRETAVLTVDNGIFGIELSLLLAIISFVISVIFGLRVLLPTSGWRFEDSPALLISALETRGANFGIDELHAVLSKEKEARFDGNEKLMQNAHRNLFFAACAAFSQAVFWCLALILIGA